MHTGGTSKPSPERSDKELWNIRASLNNPITVAAKMLALWCHALLFFSSLYPSSALDSSGKWSSVVNTPQYGNLSSCAQACLSGVDNRLSCWSYGCVCSESTVGANFLNGTRLIESCVRSSCVQPGDSLIEASIGAFKDICGISGFNWSASVTVSGTATVTVLPTATPSFDRKNIARTRSVPRS